MFEWYSAAWRMPFSLQCRKAADKTSCHSACKLRQRKLMFARVLRGKSLTLENMTLSGGISQTFEVAEK